MHVLTNTSANLSFLFSLGMIAKFIPVGTELKSTVSTEMSLAQYLQSWISKSAVQFRMSVCLYFFHIIHSYCRNEAACEKQTEKA